MHNTHLTSHQIVQIFHTFVEKRAAQDWRVATCENNFLGQSVAPNTVIYADIVSCFDRVIAANGGCAFRPDSTDERKLLTEKECLRTIEIGLNCLSQSASVIAKIQDFLSVGLLVRAELVVFQDDPEMVAIQIWAEDKDM